MLFNFSEQPLKLSKVDFSGYLFGAKFLPSTYFLEQVVVLSGRQFFKTATFSEDKLTRMKTSTEELLFRSRYFSTHHPTFQNSDTFNKATSSKELLFHRSQNAAFTFLGELFTQGSYFLQIATFLQHNFPEEVIFHGFTSFPYLDFLCFSQLLLYQKRSFSRFRDHFDDRIYC